MEEKNANTGLKWGATAGSVYVLIAYVLFMLTKDASVITFPKLLIPYASPVIFMIIAGLEKRKKLGGYMSFKVAMSTLFLVMVMSLLVYGIFEWALFNYIAPNLNVAYKASTIKSVTDLLTLSGSKPEDITKQLEVYKYDDFKMTIGRELQQTLFSIIKGFILAAIGSFILSRKNPNQP